MFSIPSITDDYASLLTMFPPPIAGLFPDVCRRFPVPDSSQDYVIGSVTYDTRNNVELALAEDLPWLAGSLDDAAVVMLHELAHYLCAVGITGDKRYLQAGGGDVSGHDDTWALIFYSLCQRCALGVSEYNAAYSVQHQGLDFNSLWQQAYKLAELPFADYCVELDRMAEERARTVFFDRVLAVLPVALVGSLPFAALLYVTSRAAS